MRHQPEKVGLKLESGGWIKVDELLSAWAKFGNVLTREDLEKVVAENDKKRFSFDETGTKIRANQGHSVKVEIEFEERTPPEILYHGTAEKNVKTILEKGLRKMARHHVHLSADAETARRVGVRYGKPVIFEIDTVAMKAEGFKFYISANGVWLVDRVPARFLKLTHK